MKARKLRIAITAIELRRAMSVHWSCCKITIPSIQGQSDSPRDNLTCHRQSTDPDPDFIENLWVRERRDYEQCPADHNADQNQRSPQRVRPECPNPDAVLAP